MLRSPSNSNRRAFLYASCLACFVVVPLTLGACSRNKNYGVIDLDGVLAILDEVTKQPLPNESDTANDNAESSSEGAGERINSMREESPETTQAFLAEFAKALNNAKLYSKRIGINMTESGEILGFEDSNRDSIKDSTEKELFRIFVDPEIDRVIAQQTVTNETYRRSRGYYGSSRGFWSGYIFGSMSNRHNRYYDSRPASKPDYSAMKMSGDNYHSQAVSRARASYSSARSRSGSRSFSGGK